MQEAFDAGYDRIVGRRQGLIASQPSKTDKIFRIMRMVEDTIFGKYNQFIKEDDQDAASTQGSIRAADIEETIEIASLDEESQEMPVVMPSISTHNQFSQLIDAFEQSFSYKNSNIKYVCSFLKHFGFEEVYKIGEGKELVLMSPGHAANELV